MFKEFQNRVQALADNFSTALGATTKQRNTNGDNYKVSVVTLSTYGQIFAEVQAIAKEFDAEPAMIYALMSKLLEG